MRLLRRFWPRALRVLVAVVAAVLMAIAIGPQPVALVRLSAGDPVLVSQVRTIVVGPGPAEAVSEAGFRSLAVGVVDGGTTTFAFLGNRGDGLPPDETTTFELASITKTFTGHLLADEVSRGEVRLTDRLARYLPELARSKAGTVTLEELATHRSGLPAYADLLSGATYEGYGSTDVQSEDEDTVIQQTKALELTDRGTWQYSNLGASLLGFALARAAGEPSWESLVHHRILDPLGMTSTTFARTDAGIPASAAVGHRVNGRVVAPVTGGGYLPAGTTTFTTISDMTIYARALLAGNVPGMWAMVPRYDIGGEQWIGLIWNTETVNGSDVRFHLGGVPGFSSAMVVDQNSDRSVIVLGGSEESVESIAFTLLDPSAPIGWPPESPAATWFGLLGLAFVIASIFVWARARRPLPLIAAGLAAQGGMLLLLRRGPWHLVPPWTWGLAVALVFWLTLESGRRWTKLHSTKRDLVAGGVGLLLAMAAYGVAVWLG